MGCIKGWIEDKDRKKENKIKKWNNEVIVNDTGGALFGWYFEGFDLFGWYSEGIDLFERALFGWYFEGIDLFERALFGWYFEGLDLFIRGLFWMVLWMFRLLLI